MVKERWQLKNKKLPKESDHEETFQGQIEDGIKIGEKWTRIGDGIKIGETFQGQIVEAWMLVEGPWAHSGPKQRNPLWKKCCEATQLVRVQPEQVSDPMQASLIPSLSLPQAKPVLPGEEEIPSCAGVASFQEHGRIEKIEPSGRLVNRAAC